MINLPQGTLVNLKKYTKDQINTDVRSKGISYHTSGKAFEGMVIKTVLDFLKNNEEIRLVDFHEAKTKTEWPDLWVVTEWKKATEKLFIEIKAGDSSANPENDLGTLRSLWKEHILKDLGLSNLERLFMLFVKYSKESGKITKIDEVYIGHYFHFIGNRKVGSLDILKYRKKDGNLRPVSWEEMKRIRVEGIKKEELTSFLKKYYLATIYRSMSIVKEHEKIIGSCKNIESFFKEEIGIEKLDIDLERLCLDLQPKTTKLLNGFNKKSGYKKLV